MKWLREFDLEYWQMRSALGYSIPVRIDERWPGKIMRNNPYQCGICAARQKNPHLFVRNYDEVRVPAGDEAGAAKHKALGFEHVGWDGPSPGFDVFRRRKHCSCYAEANPPN